MHIEEEDMAWWQFLFGKKDKKKTNEISYEPLPKYYVFNETGNIMLCTTKEGVSQVNEEFRTSCAEVSVFFSAMSKALSTTPIPKEKDTDPTRYYSIYHCDALEKILENSGLFIEVNDETVHFSCKGVGNHLNKALMEAALGRKFGETKLHFARGILSTIKRNRDEAHQNADPHFSAGSIFFVCEILLGMPVISAILVKIDPLWKKNKTKEGNIVHRTDEDDNVADLFTLANEDEDDFEYQGNERYWEIEKHTFLFTPPTVLKAYVGNLETTYSAEMESFVENLKNIIAPAQKSVNKP